MVNSPLEPRPRRRFTRCLGMRLALGGAALISLAIIGVGVAFPATAAIAAEAAPER